MIRRFRRLKRGAAIATTVAMAGALGLSAAPAGAVTSGNGFAFTRIAGQNRFGTAAALAQQAFPNGAATVLIATGFNFPDALAGNYLAGQDQAPILLVNASGPVPQETLSALQTLRTKNVIILGLTAAVGADVQQQLASTTSSASGGGNLNVTRIGGTTRFDTAQLINETPGAAAVGTFQGKKTAFLATGANFPDALGAGPVAFAEKFPVILTDPNTLSPQASKTISDLGIQQLLVLGGTAAVSQGVETAADVNGVTTLARFAGSNRSDTSRLLADFAITNFGFKNSRFTVASGDQAFGGADALASGPFSANQGPIPTLVTNSVNDPGAVVTFAQEHSGTEQSGFAAGGTNPLPDSTLAAISAAITNPTTPPTATVLPQLVSASIRGTTTTTQANSTNPAGTTVQYVFSQNVSGGVLNANGFHIYDSSGGRFTANVVGFDNTNPNAVDALFTSQGGGAAPNNGTSNLQTTSGAANLTLATVGGPQDTGGTTGTTAVAVQTPAGQSPDGQAAIGSANSGTAPAAGVTAAPNPESFAVTQTGGGGMVGGTSFANSTPVNVTFDKPTFVQTAANPATNPPSSTGFSVVFTTTQGAGPAVNEEACTAPGTVDTTTPSGGTVPGGNGTATITILCPDRPGAPNTPIAGTSIARVVVAQGAVGTAAQAGSPNNGNVVNPLEVTDTPHGASDSPDLTSVAFVSGSGGANGTGDQIVFTFDQAVKGAVGSNTGNPPVATGFAFYQSNGTQVNCSANGAPGPGTLPCTVAVNPSNFTQVIVTVGTTAGAGNAGPTGSNVTFSAAGASVAAGTVTAANSGLTNGDDEQGALNPNGSATTVTPGIVATPELQKVTISTTGALGPSATYTFDVPVTLANQAGLHLYDSNGTELTCATAPAAQVGTTSTTSGQVTCFGFTQSAGAGTTAATGTQIQTAVLGTADFNTVTGNVTGGAPSSGPNPEGGINTTTS